jgi:pyruvate dehydrogenase E2 component (dihydrolipoamide acetyltransferase)
MSDLVEVKVPDIGDFKNIPVIEVLVQPGDAVGAEDSLITLESDKATLEVPSPVAGTVKEVKVHVGDKVSQGTLVLLLEKTGSSAQAAKPESAPKSEPAKVATSAPAPAEAAPRTAPPAPPREAPQPRPAPLARAQSEASSPAHASPSVRQLARDFGVDLTRVQATGPKGRILKEDVQAYVKSELGRGPAADGTGLRIAPAPEVDFA